MKKYSVEWVWTKAQIALTALGGWLGGLLGGADGLLTALIAMMALDYLTGVACALLDRRLSSAVGFRGVCKKALILTLVGVAHLLDSRVTGTGGALRGAVICFYLSNEALSLVENAARAGLPVPDRLRAALQQLRDGEEGKPGGR